MIKLTDRLQLIADMIETGETMADIGTDHGFLPLSLIESGKSPRVIMCDISGPSLDKAREAAAQMGITSGAECREGDGLDVIESGEVDAVVIAGMGGLLITQILAKDPAKTASIRKYIFQPRNNAALLRWWLTSKGFEITKNSLVREGKFICEVISALTPKSLEAGDFGASGGLLAEEDPSWALPADITSREEGLEREFALLKLAQENKKLEGLKKSKNTDREEIKKAEERMAYFRRFANDRI